MWQDRRMRLCVRHVERAAQCMAELVVERDAYGAQDAAREPAPIKRIRARRGIGRIGQDQRQAPRQRSDALLGHERHDRSEEHTSELQSLMRSSSAVFCLKKKK